jgi:CRISPR-associated endonuclease Cas3-HD
VANGCGRKNGKVPEKLAFLAGLCHDLAKSAPAWQEYIRSNGAIKKGPPHAPTGAALFAVWAEDLIAKWEPIDQEREKWIDLALDWARVIDHHHGRLDDLGDDPPWFNPGVWEEHQPATLIAACDRVGLDALVRKHFPECSTSLMDFAAQLEQVRRTSIPPRCIPLWSAMPVSANVRPTRP